MSETSRQFPPGQHPDLPPPRLASGPIYWIRENLLSSWLNIALTLVAVYFLYWLIPTALNWALFDAVFTAESRKECLSIGSGACLSLIHI